MIDTHCHIHDDNFELNADEVLQSAFVQGVEGVICVGTDAVNSRQAIEFASSRDNVWAAVGLHPHDATKPDMDMIAQLASDNGVVAIGECGLDYYYDNSSQTIRKSTQMGFVPVLSYKLIF